MATRKKSGGSELVVYTRKAEAQSSVSARTGKVGLDISSTNGQGPIASPYDHQLLANLYSLNTYHARCVNAKARLTAGLGYEIQGLYKNTQPSDADKKTFDEFVKRHGQLTGQHFTETLVNFETDYEIYGNAFFEGVRNNAGKIAEIYHIPGRECRLETEMIDKDSRATRIILKQIVLMQTATFKAFGTEPTLTRNEYLQMKNYCPTNRYYGNPEYIAALPAISLDRSAMEFNIRRFQNNGVPDFIVTVSGGQLDKAASGMIRKYWEENLKGVENTGKTLILQTDDGEAEIKIEKLNGDVKEASFRLLRGDNRDEVIAAHGIPPRMVGVVQQGAGLGNGSESKEQLKVFRSVVLNPRQARLEFMLNERLLPAIGINTLKVKLNALEAGDTADDATFFKTLIDSGVINADEARTEMGYGPRPDASDATTGKLEGIVKALWDVRRDLEGR